MKSLLFGFLSSQAGELFLPVPDLPCLTPACGKQGRQASGIQCLSGLGVGTLLFVFLSKYPAL
ncbi:MAG: hypothetical protein ACQES1_07730 [Bacteroidota bacterium]